jgi:hypothetical protein
MVKITPNLVKSSPASKGSSKGFSKGAPAGSRVSKTIGWLNKNGPLNQPISYSDVADVLTALGEDSALQLLHELSEKGLTINDPTGWLLKAATNAATGGGSRKGGWGKGSSKGWSDYSSPGYGQFVPMSMIQHHHMIQPSQWIGKTIGRLNKTETLKQPVIYNDVIGALSIIPESVAIGLVKELGTKAEEVKDPSGWLIKAAANYNKGGKKWSTSTEVSKKVGELNKSGLFKDRIMWNEVAGPLLCMEEDEAMALIGELEEKAAEVKQPTNWLKSAAERSFKKPKN